MAMGQDQENSLCWKTKARVFCSQLKWDIDDFGTFFPSATTRGYVGSIQSIAAPLKSPTFYVEVDIDDNIRGLVLKVDLGLSLEYTSSSAKCNDPNKKFFRLDGTFKWNKKVYQQALDVEPELQFIDESGRVCFSKDLDGAFIQSKDLSDGGVVGGSWGRVRSLKDFSCDLNLKEEYTGYMGSTQYTTDNKVRIRINLKILMSEHVNEKHEEYQASQEESLAELYEDIRRHLLSQPNDITIMCDDEVFPAHKIILSARSSVFARMFATDMKESSTSVVKIEDVESDIVSLMLTYICTAKLPFKDMEADKLCKLAQAADKYDISKLLKTCFNELLCKMNEKNVVQIAQIARLCSSAAPVRERIWEFCSKNWNKLSADVEIMNLAKEFPDAFFKPAQ